MQLKTKPVHAETKLNYELHLQLINKLRQPTTTATMQVTITLTYIKSNLPTMQLKNTSLQVMIT